MERFIDDICSVERFLDVDDCRIIPGCKIATFSEFRRLFVLYTEGPLFILYVGILISANF